MIQPEMENSPTDEQREAWRRQQARVVSSVKATDDLSRALAETPSLHAPKSGPSYARLFAAMTKLAKLDTEIQVNREERNIVNYVKDFAKKALQPEGGGS